VAYFGTIKVFARKLTDVAAEIRTDNLPNKSPKRYNLSLVPQSKEEEIASCLCHIFKQGHLIYFFFCF
jgi:hypothetical protein